MSSYFIAIILAFSCVGSSLSAENQPCHLRELDICAATLVVFTQNSGTPTQATDRDIDRQCQFIREAEQCRKNYTDRCLTPLQRELMDFVSESGQSSRNDFCTPGTKVREDYKKHSKCMAQARQQSKNCNTDLQAALESVKGTIWNKRVALACCSINRFEMCGFDKLRAQCGEEAVKLAKKVIRFSSARFTDIVCQSYSAESPQCQGLLPPIGTQPNGSSSNSLLSRLFGTYAN